MRIIALALLTLGKGSQAFSTASTSNYRFYQQSTTSLNMSSKKVLVPIADGSEEIETACITDTLTRFGAEVTIASVMGGNLVCKMSRGMKVRHYTATSN